MMLRIFFLYLLFLLPYFNLSFAYKYELAICAITKDEAPYIKEWIEFHKIVGVEHFYIYCHENQPEYLEVLDPYIKKGEVEVLSTDPYAYLGDANEISVFNPLQCKAYTDLLNSLKDVVKWMAVIDTDEFLFSPLYDDLTDFLREYEDIPGLGGIAANWQMFGTSSCPKIPQEKTLIETLTRTSVFNYSTNIHVKTIVRPEYVSFYDQPHSPIFLPGYFKINTDKIPFLGSFSPYVRFDKLQINHYWTRDEDFFFHQKLPRQKKWGNSITDEKAQLICEELNKDQNFLILKFLNPLRLALGLDKAP